MAFLAGGLFLAPIINGGKDPKYQKLGVDVLFWALVVLVVGSFTGSYLAIAHIIPEEWSFLFGHQGYEFIDLVVLASCEIRRYLVLVGINATWHHKCVQTTGR